VRVRVVNDVTGRAEWHTIACVPFVRKLKKPGAAEKAKGRRWGVLQRTLFLAFREAISASYKGVELGETISGFLLAFFRVLLYSCDQPEEHAVLCMKGRDCARPCSHCEVLTEHACTSRSVDAADREVISTVEGRMGATTLRLTGRKRPRRVILETQSSNNAFIPALACMGGLTTAPHHLYKMIALDPLHVSRGCQNTGFWPYPGQNTNTVNSRYNVHEYKRLLQIKTEVGVDHMRAGLQIEAPDAVQKPWLLERTASGSSKFGGAGPGGVGQFGSISDNVRTE